MVTLVLTSASSSETLSCSPLGRFSLPLTLKKWVLPDIHYINALRNENWVNVNLWNMRSCYWIENELLPLSNCNHFCFRSLGTGTIKKWPECHSGWPPNPLLPRWSTGYRNDMDGCSWRETFGANCFHGENDFSSLSLFFFSPHHQYTLIVIYCS